MKVISKIKLQEMKRDGKEAEFVVYTPNRKAAEKLFSVYKPNPRYKGEKNERTQTWTKLVDKNPSNYRTIAFYIKDGYVDSYCSLEYFQDENERYDGKYGNIYQLSDKRFEVGDIVHIKENIQIDPNNYGHLTDDMFKRRGEFAIIRDAGTDGYYKIEEDPFWWGEDLLEPPSVPVVKVGKVIIPKCHNIVEVE